MKLHYKGYITILEQDPDSKIWHGRVSGIQDVVTFEGKTQVLAEQEFHKSIDAYLQFCAAISRSPNQPSATPSQNPSIG
jgi:predicted HicB family RNase H-like nuclease